MDLDDVPLPTLYLPSEDHVEGDYVLSIADYFRRPIKEDDGIHTRMVVLAKHEHGDWRVDTPHSGDSVTRPFGLDEHGRRWFAALLKAVHAQGEVDLYNDVALTRVMVGRPFLGRIKVSEPKGLTGKRFVNVVRFTSITPEATAAIKDLPPFKIPRNARVYE